MSAERREYLAYLALGVILGVAGYIVAGTLWVANFAWQNALAG